MATQEGPIDMPWFKPRETIDCVLQRAADGRLIASPIELADPSLPIKGYAQPKPETIPKVTYSYQGVETILA